MDKQLLMDGLQLLVLGMGTVYVFLIVMIGAMKLMGKLLAPFANALEAPVAPVRKQPSVGAADVDMAAAAAAAVDNFRNK